MKPGSGWPLAIVAVLAMTVAANIALLWQANAAGGNDVEPDYYRRALAWDSTQAAHARSVALGWRAEAGFAAAGSGATLEVVLEDSLAQPLPGASVTVVGLHNLDPLHALTWKLAETAPGRYGAVVQLPHAGRWELRVSARRGSDDWLGVLHAEAPGAARP
jgi:nitrogen fixation protein FixH